MDVSRLRSRSLITLLFAVSVLLTERAAAQLWTYRDSPSTQNLRGIAFADSLYGVIVGDYGTLLRTTDGGAHWEARASGTSEHLRAVSLLADGTGIIVGANGTILHSTDAFASWTTQHAGTTAFLLSVACLDAAQAFAVGVNGVIIHTSDAGVTWAVQPTGTPAAFHSVVFRNDSSAVAVGSYGVLAQTTDRGSHWSLPPLPYRPVLDAVHFFDELNGFIFGDAGVGYGTSDGGATWWPRQLSTRFVAIAPSGPSSCAAVGGGLSLTSDTGTLWSTEYVPDPFESASFRDPLTLFAVGLHGLVSACLLDQTEAPAVALDDPPDNASNVQMLMNESVQLGVRLRWRQYGLYMPSSLHLQLGTDSTFFSGLRFDGPVNAPALTDTNAVVADLLPGETYYWRIRAEFGLRTAPWSATRHFTPTAGPYAASVRRIQRVPADSLLLADALQDSDRSRSGLQSSTLRDSVLLVVGVCTVPTADLRTTMQSLNFDWNDWFMLADTGADSSAWGGLTVVNSRLGPFANDTLFWGIRTGDVVMITGKILEDPASDMNSQTFLSCLTIRLLDSGRTVPAARPVSVRELYHGRSPNGSVPYSTGEQYEGMYVELTNLSVYDGGDVQPGTVTLIDGGGNTITTSDLSRWFTLREHRSPLSTYVPPTLGTRIDTLRGLITVENGRYRIMPVHAGDMVFGAPRSGFIGGVVFNDENRNGIQDPGEAPMPGWRIDINGKIRATLSTDDLGRYAVSGLDSGAYAITRGVRLGWAQSVPDSAWAVALGVNDSLASNNFGVYFQWNTIAGRVYHDLDENGRPDSADPGLAGWKVLLNGETVDSAVTDKDGNYVFPFVKSGVHTVHVALEPSWEETVPVYLRGYQLDFHAFDIHETGLDFSVHPIPLRSKFGVTVANNIGTSRELWLGTRPGASYGIWGVDPQATNFDYSEGESEIPPQTSGIFDARFVDPRGSDLHFGEGGWTDVRNFTSPSEVDSYKVSFLPGYFFGGNYPMTFRWSHSWVATYYSGPVLLVDPLGNVTDMKGTDSVVIADPSISTLLIITANPQLTIAGAPVPRAGLPTHYALGQNYPNPFNPVTTIDFDLPAAAAVSVVVYDLLGREIAAPVRGSFPPGRFHASWDAAGMPSGVYFYRLTAGTYVETRKMLLLR